MRWQIEILFKTWKSLFSIHRVKKRKKERFECHLYGTLIRILLCSTLAFQIRRCLYEKKQMETSEYKAIRMVKKGIEGIANMIIHAFLSWEEIISRLYESVKINGGKARRYKKQTVFDILHIAYEQHFSLVA